MFHVKPGAEAAAVSDLAPATPAKGDQGRWHSPRFGSSPDTPGPRPIPDIHVAFHVKQGASQVSSIFTEPHNRPGSNVPRESVAGGARRVGYSP